jgi:hypothetical protein
MDEKFSIYIAAFLMQIVALSYGKTRNISINYVILVDRKLYYCAASIASDLNSVNYCTHSFKTFE